MLRKEVSEFPLAHVPGITDAFMRTVRQQTLNIEHKGDANADWICWQSGLGYLPLDIQIPWQVIQQEAHGAVNMMAPQTITSHDSRGWTNLGLYSSLDDEVDQYRSADTGVHDWTSAALALMPETVRYFRDEWPHGEFYKIRLLGLAPGGVIGLHSDDCHGLDNFNLAIDHPIGCEFGVEGAGIVPFENGRAFMINVGRRHAVINPTGQLRLHITMYQSHDARMRQLIEQSYQKLCATG